MKRSLLGLGILALVGLAPAAMAQSPAAASGVPSLSLGSGSVSPAPSGSRQMYEHVMRGVVALERNGAPMAVGTVLSGDGRVLTALSGLAGGDGADVLYADGTVVHAKVGRSDRASDLALLVPQSLKWTEGLSASDADPDGQDLRAMLPATAPGGSRATDGRLSPVVAAVKGQIDAHARDGAALLRLLDVELKGAPVAGAPLLDSTGSVVGVLVRACKGAPAVGPAPEAVTGAWDPTSRPSAVPRAACKLLVLGAPVSAIRAFLSSAAPAAPAVPWLGIRGQRELAGNVHGVRVVAVAPASPAQAAALKPAADVIVAVDGHPVDSPETLAEVIGRHAAGDTVKLLVFSTDQFHEVTVALRPAP